MMIDLAVDLADYGAEKFGTPNYVRATRWSTAEDAGLVTGLASPMHSLGPLDELQKGGFNRRPPWLVTDEHDNLAADITAASTIILSSVDNVLNTDIDAAVQGFRRHVLNKWVTHMPGFAPGGYISGGNDE